MAERQTIIERVARYIMVLEGGEEVEKRIEVVDEKFTRMASQMRNNVKMMNELSQALRVVGRTMSGTVLQQLPQTTAFLEQFAVATEGAAEKGMELTLTEFALSQEGRELATSLGLVIPKLRETETGATGLKDAFWKLNSMARALLRVFVAFKILTGVIGIFRDMAEATANLQRELWSLRVIISSAGQDIEGGLGSWDDWLERIQRLRRELPLINMTDLVRGVRTLIVTLDNLGLSADQMEYIIELAGQMAVIMGVDFPSYSQRLSTALQGQTRNWQALGVNLTESSKALMDFTEDLGYNWDELNKQQRILIRTLVLTKEFIRITEDAEDILDTQVGVLEALRAERADLIAQQPKLIQFQIVWNQLLILGTEFAAKAAEAITRFFATIVSGIAAVTVVVLEILQGLKEGKAGWWEFEGGLERFGKVQDEIYQGIMEGSTVLDYLREKLDETGEKVEEAADPFAQLVAAMKLMIDAAADSEDALDDLADAFTRAFQQGRDALRSYEQAVAQAGIRLSRRFADIARNLEERLADLESKFELRRSQLITRFEERRAELREEGAEKEEELRADLNKRLRRMEEDHQNDMRELREDYLIDLEEAARKLDAVSMRKIQQRYILEKKQRERAFGVRHRRAIDDFKAQIAELKKAREEQERELEKSLERQLRELQENYERQQEEARLNAERQREDAARNNREQLDDLERNFRDRLDAIITNLEEEELTFEEVYERMRDFFDTWSGDYSQAFADWLNDLARMAGEFGLVDPIAPIHPRDPSDPGWTEFAQGGMGIARGPTPIIVGEAGPEMFAAWPLGQRMPSQAMDIRLTIDGTQSGAWSGDFENQVVRIFKEIVIDAIGGE